MILRPLLTLALCLGVTSATCSTDTCLDIFAKSSKSKYYEWVGINMRFPCESTRNILLDGGFHIPRHLMPTRFQVHPITHEVYVAMPRYKPGTAVTLAKAKVKKSSCIPVFYPFPCFSMQELGSCDSIQSAIDLVFDNLGRLWVLDSGVINTLMTPRRECPPKIVVICTLTKKVINTIDLSEIAGPLSRLQYLVLDQSILGQTYLYISDAASRSIIVWDVNADFGWRVGLPPIVLDGSKDVFYIALVQHKDASTFLYFTYLSSTRMFYINCDFLQRRVAQGVVINLGKKPNQLVLLGSDRGTKLFFRFQGDSIVYQWNTLDCFQPDNFIQVHQGTGCRLATHVAPGFFNTMYGIETNFYDYIKDTTGCLGPSISLFPLIKSKSDNPFVSIKEDFFDFISNPLSILNL